MEDNNITGRGLEEVIDGDNTNSVYIGIAGAVSKLQEELKNAEEKDFANPIIEHLIERCKKSESLSSDVCQAHKTWEECIKYIYEQARKQAKGRSCAVRDNVVYEWAEDYYHKDDESGKKEETKKPVRKKAMEAEPDTLPEGVNIGQDNMDLHAEAEKRETQSKPKKNRDMMEGQVDLFSLMEM